IFLFVTMAFTVTAFAQNKLTITLKDAESQEPLIGATVFISNLNRGSSSNADGQVLFSDIPDGTHAFEYRYLGYASKVDSLTFPFASGEPIVILLEAEEGEELEEVVVSSTRSSRTIANLPTRIEVIAGEE